MSPFGKVLVANRGEIAVRVFRTLRELGISTVAVYSEADRGSLHASVADEAYLVGPGAPSESYLSRDRIIDAARRSGAEAVHPGYGFLAENASFARACADAGLVWIGPPPEAIEVMGSKVAARELMRSAGVPIIPGTTEPVTSAAEVSRLGDEFGWPLAIKASAGGGGKGLKVVESADEAERAFAAAQREGESYFADHLYWATAVFAVAMATDQVDGWLARRRNETSAFGSLLDPIADKVLVLAALVMLIAEGVAPAWMIAAIVAREIAVSGLRLAALERGVVIGARDLGKLKTWAQTVAATIAGLQAAGAWETDVAWWALLVATLLTWISGLDYARVAPRVLRREGAAT
jgi:CDP-diacylglycerol--glycerol-3-phosphate 3-phosphatidyltransferase